MYQSLKVFYWYCCCWYFLSAILTGTNSQFSRCNKLQWKCNNGNCINAEERCDGQVHCSDRSDETAESCSDIDCPGFAFRCAYGACIAGNSKCNGINDCADASDEAPALCKQGQDGEKEVSRNCSLFSFQCDSGQCIADDKACDGKKDCTDGSDETAKLCSSLSCPSFAFKCGYGACISGNAKCNGVAECHDGSDESSQLCKSGQAVTPRPPPFHITDRITNNIFFDSVTRPTITTTTTTTTTASTTGDIDILDRSTSCLVGDHEDVIILADYDNTVKIHAGEWVETFRGVDYKCKPNHFLFGKLTNTCVNGVWINPIPSCSKVCSSKALDGVTFVATCSYNGTGQQCSELIRPGTRAGISCAVGYRKPQRVVPELLVCDETGEWDYHPYRCEPVCGTELIDTRPFVAGGVNINIATVPWHAAIYRLDNERYRHICGGTIISAKIIISAAHCFWNARNDKPNDHRIYAVGVGKTLRDYYASESRKTQFFNLSEIHVPSVYKDVSLSYQNDIAVLVLNNFIEFKSHIKPICIVWYKYRQMDILPGTIGRIVGWGRTDENAGYSEELKTVELPSVSSSECIKNATQAYNTYITGEKFCVGAPNSESVCEGDSGGGFAVPMQIDGITTYHLWGVLSVTLSKSSCQRDYFTSFTNIQYHKEMITDYESRYRPK